MGLILIWGLSVAGLLTVGLIGVAFWEVAFSDVAQRRPRAIRPLPDPATLPLLQGPALQDWVRHRTCEILRSSWDDARQRMAPIVQQVQSVAQWYGLGRSAWGDRPACSSHPQAPIEVSVLEACAIASELREGPARDRSLVLQRARQNVQAMVQNVQPMAQTKGEARAVSVTCPLLGADGRCGARQWRPLQCRRCAGDSVSEGVASDGIGPTTYVIAGAMLGLSDTLRERACDANRYELNDALSIMLAGNSSDEAWLAGGLRDTAQHGS